MTEDRLIELIESWGADPSAFPQAERGAARALLAAHPERFATAIAEARALDAALAQMPDVFPPPALTAAGSAAPDLLPSTGLSLKPLCYACRAHRLRSLVSFDIRRAQL